MARCDVDILVVGAGMVGTTFALAAWQQGFRVALVDAAAPITWQDDLPPELRVSAISPASARVLQHVQAWPQVLARRARAYRHMWVREGRDGGRVHFDAAELSEPHLGHIVENRLLQWALQQQLADCHSLSWLPQQRIEAVQILPQRAEVFLSQGRRLSAQLLVGADGANSQLRRLCGMDVAQASYASRALVATVQTAEPSDTTWQQFEPHGPLAYLPLYERHASLVWYDSDAANRQRQSVPEAAFLDALQRTFPPELGQIERVLGRGSFPLQRLHARSYVRARVALIGDAAHAIHPLAGQGVNLGILDAAALAEVLQQQRHRRGDCGDPAGLRRYEAMRRVDNARTLWAMDGIDRLFSNAHPPLKFLRSQGLAWANRLPWGKRLAIRQATGIDRRDLPALARQTHESI